MAYFFHAEPDELQGVRFGNEHNWGKVLECFKGDDAAALRVLVVHGPSGVGKEVTTKRLAELTGREVRLLEVLDMPRQNTSQKAEVVKMLNEYTRTMHVLAHQQLPQKLAVVMLHGVDNFGGDVLAGLREFVATPPKGSCGPIVCIVNDKPGLLKLSAPPPGTVLTLRINRLQPKDMQEFAQCRFKSMRKIARDDPRITESCGDMRKFELAAQIARLKPAGATGRESGVESARNDRRLDIFAHTKWVLSSHPSSKEGADPVDSDDRMYEMLQFNYLAACGEDEAMMAAAADAAEVFSAGDCLRLGWGPRTDAAEWMARSALVGGQELVDVKYPDSLKSGAGARRVQARASSMWEGSQWKALRSQAEPAPYNFN